MEKSTDNLQKKIAASRKKIRPSPLDKPLSLCYNIHV